MQVAVELPDVLARIADLQRAVCRDRAAQQQHRVLVHAVEHAAAADLVAGLGKLGVDARAWLIAAYRRAVRSRPIGQGPGVGDDGRAEAPRSTGAVFTSAPGRPRSRGSGPDSTSTPPTAAAATRTAAPASAQVLRLTLGLPPPIHAPRRFCIAAFEDGHAAGLIRWMGFGAC